MAIHFVRYIALLLIVVKFIEPQILDSPCPSLFAYEPITDPDKWYGVVTLISPTALSGVWVRVALDQPAIQLESWSGEVVADDAKKVFRIKMPDHKLPANSPYQLFLNLKYDPSLPIPRVVELQLNSKTFCRENGAATISPIATSTFWNFTSGPLSPTARPTISTTATVRSTTRRTTGLNSGTFIRPQIFTGIRPSEDDFVIDQAQIVEEECGVVPVTAQPIISNGIRVKLGEIPWHVAIYHSHGGGLEYACGGSLISRYHIITAGHCVTDYNLDAAKVLRPDQVVVHLGKDNLKDWSSSSYQLREVDLVTRHPDYDEQNYKNDIAVLKLLSAAQYTNTVRPVCLSERDEDIDNLAGELGVIAGFGYNEQGKVSAVLIKTQIPVIKQTACIFSFPEFYSRYGSNTAFCAGYTNGTTVCNGDSGGGLVFQKKTVPARKKVYYLRGIASIILRDSGIGDDRKCSPEHYPLFTDVSKYLAFIKVAMSL